MGGIFTQRPDQSNPVGVTRQNDFREVARSEQEEHDAWERSTSGLATPLKPGGVVEVPTNTVDFVTLTSTTGVALNGTLGLTPPLRLLSNDPQRRRAIIMSFSTAQMYLARDPGGFNGFDRRVAVLGNNAAPMPNMGFVEVNNFEIFGTCEVWAMQIANATTATWLSIQIERAARLAP